MAKAKKVVKPSYGIAEWYGVLFRNMHQSERIAILDQVGIPDCPFMISCLHAAPFAKNGERKTKCNKKGGVCSLRQFYPGASPGSAESFGAITTTCPMRFIEDGRVFSQIAEVVLGTTDPLLVKEIPFLKRLPEPSNSEQPASDVSEDAGQDGPEKEDVGRIDMVLAHPAVDDLRWCAVEMQAVYFSGHSMSRDFSAIRAFGASGVPLPGARRRPDFRSSGPKRLMPQLMTKVPALRRWGIKTVVVVDEAFFESLGSMDNVPHISNADIVWAIVGYDEAPESGKAAISVKRFQFSTLERGVEGLTAGTPTDKDQFQAKILEKLEREGHRTSKS